jgi:hypothetical protein
LAAAGIYFATDYHEKGGDLLLHLIYGQDTDNKDDDKDKKDAE